MENISEIEIYNELDSRKQRVIADKRFTAGAVFISKYEYKIWLKYGGDKSRYCCHEAGFFGHDTVRDRNTIGVYTPRKGYYLVMDVLHYSISARSGLSFDGLTCSKYANEIPFENINYYDDRKIKMPLYAKYDSLTDSDFLDEIVLIDARPFYNNSSIGPKCAISAGMIIHVYEETTVENESYVVKWELIDKYGIK